VSDETREWESGAYRDTNEDKLDYEAFYSPLVMREFALYMHKHRHQANGKLRAGDNWQGLFGEPEEHRKVCMGSLVRHVLDLWLFHRGHTGRETIKEALCAILFNAQAYLFSLLIEEQDEHLGTCPLCLFTSELERRPNGERIFHVDDEFLGEVQVYSSPAKLPVHCCDQEECIQPATRQLMYLYEGIQVTTWRCAKHETMPIQREDDCE